MEHRLRFKDVIDIAAPGTWAASVMPSVLATVISYQRTGSLRIDMMVCLFIIAILMQSSVNALNDYADFIKGADTLDNSHDASDAVIVYGLRPETARNLGIAFLVSAFVPGIYTVIKCGIVPLVIGIIGALVIVGYSYGKNPISYLPLGEFVSGFVMGGLIPLAGVYMQTDRLDHMVLVLSLPVIIGIGMIMFSNNSCDIEKDLPVGRRTLACMLGRGRTEICYRTMLLIWVATPVILFAVMGRYLSMLVYILESTVFLNGIIRQATVPLNEKFRGAVMGGITNLGIAVEFAYFAAMQISG